MAALDCVAQHVEGQAHKISLTSKSTTMYTEPPGPVTATLPRLSSMPLQPCGSRDCACVVVPPSPIFWLIWTLGHRSKPLHLLLIHIKLSSSSLVHSLLTFLFRLSHGTHPTSLAYSSMSLMWSYQTLPARLRHSLNRTTALSAGPSTVGKTEGFSFSQPHTLSSSPFSPHHLDFKLAVGPCSCGPPPSILQRPSTSQPVHSHHSPENRLHPRVLCPG
jgi:hypothetical protein